MIHLISELEDFYQHKDSPQFAVRTFIPCDQSEINEYPVFNGSSFLNMFTMDMQWFLATATYKHHSLARQNYNLKNANEFGKIPGEVKDLVEMKGLFAF
jgi:hypothetical protein